MELKKRCSGNRNKFNSMSFIFTKSLGLIQFIKKRLFSKWNFLCKKSSVVLSC